MRAGLVTRHQPQARSGGSDGDAQVETEGGRRLE
jgi:hypothetical protein